MSGAYCYACSCDPCECAQKRAAREARRNALTAVEIAAALRADPTKALAVLEALGVVVWDKEPVPERRYWIDGKPGYTLSEHEAVVTLYYGSGANFETEQVRYVDDAPGRALRVVHPLEALDVWE